MDIVYKNYEPTLVATTRIVMNQHAEIKAALDELAGRLPAAAIVGPPFAIFNFITSVTGGQDVEVGFPITEALQLGDLKMHLLPAMETLSLVHHDAPEQLDETYRRLFGFANEHALISDEFCREVYLDAGTPGGAGTEVQLVIHNWNDKLAHSLARVLGEQAQQSVMQGAQALKIESSLDERFEWVNGMLVRLNDLADDYQKYDILSSCAHVYPAGQLAKLQAVFQEVKARTNDVWQAVDAVLDFMEADPGWGETRPTRQGNVIYAAKKPRNPKAYAAATNDLERRRAACFCPIIRNKLDQGMPLDFCYCGSGWYRQQWEAAISRPVTVEVLQSVLRGDEACRFAIHLPQEW